MRTHLFHKIETNKEVPNVEKRDIDILKGLGSAIDDCKGVSSDEDVEILIINVSRCATSTEKSEGADVNPRAQPSVIK